LEMIEARAEELDADALADEDAWHQHIDATAGNLLRIYTMLAGAVEQVSDEEVKRMARAQAYVGLARAVPVMVREGAIRLPQHYMEAAGLPYTLGALATPSDALEKCILSLCKSAEEMTFARPKVECLRGVHLILQARIKQLQKARYNPYDSGLKITPISLTMRLLMNSIIS